MDTLDALEREYLALPIEVRAILDQCTGDEDYQDCANIQMELESIGWTCEYYLDAQIYGVRKIGEPIPEHWK